MHNVHDDALASHNNRRSMSSRLHVVIPEDLHDRLRKVAKVEKTSVGEIVRTHLEQRFKTSGTRLGRRKAPYATK